MRLSVKCKSYVGDEGNFPSLLLIGVDRHTSHLHLHLHFPSGDNQRNRFYLEIKLSRFDKDEVSRNGENDPSRWMDEPPPSIIDVEWNWKTMNRKRLRKEEMIFFVGIFEEKLWVRKVQRTFTVHRKALSASFLWRFTGVPVVIGCSVT